MACLRRNSDIDSEELNLRIIRGTVKELTNFLGGMNPRQFLEEYWAKKPLLIKGAVKNASTFATPQKILEWVQDSMLESRVVEFNGDDYQAADGPFDKTFVDEHADKEGMTWIVHGMNLFDKNFFELEKLARFQPNWKFDDVMITCSTQGGTVGPHIDSYNVFIIQGKGKKRWLLNTHPNRDEAINPNLRLLKEMEVEIEWELEEGDMIYIPPHVAHHGITESEWGLSYSVGYKSFKAQEVFSGYFAAAMNHLDTEQVFEPVTKLTEENEVFSMRSEVVDDLFQQFQENYLSRDIFSLWMGEHLTAPRWIPEENDDLDFDEFKEELQTRPFYRDEHTKILKIGDRHFAGGEVIECLESDWNTLIKIAALPAWSLLDKSLLQGESLQSTLFELYCRGLFYFTE